jgi:hypothetical protein
LLWKVMYGLSRVAIRRSFAVASGQLAG